MSEKNNAPTVGLDLGDPSSDRSAVVIRGSGEATPEQIALIRLAFERADWRLMSLSILPPEFDLHALLRKQQAFSERTFGPGRRTGMVCDHMRKELVEVEAAPDDLREWVDLILLAFDGAWRTGATPEQISDAMANKLAANERRQWPDWRTSDPDRAIEHLPERGCGSA
ncbi:MAG: dATP/dGTP pyrophosphohydrolase domain-containing protein [Burkholderia gladioli]